MKKTAQNALYTEESKAKNNLSYDDAMARVETIVKQLEQSDALSMDEYKQLATEAKTLLDFCRQQLEKDQVLLTSDWHFLLNTTDIHGELSLRDRENILAESPTAVLMAFYMVFNGVPKNGFPANKIIWLITCSLKINGQLMAINGDIKVISGNYCRKKN